MTSPPWCRFALCVHFSAWSASASQFEKTLDNYNLSRGKSAELGGTHRVIWVTHMAILEADLDRNEEVFL